ncbi:MAG: hypothetical protein IPH20_21330 [Bacteroidales bacterium]|nr:hypothetical protein [Bacteroidales bacterium]
MQKRESARYHPERSNGDLESLNLNLNTETRFSDSSVLKVKSWLYTSERGLPGAVIYYNPYSVQRMNTVDFSAMFSMRTSGKVNLLSKPSPVVICVTGILLT